MANDTLITVIGNLTADPEVKHLDSGAAVVSLTIASTPRTFDRQTNDWKDGETLFLRASAWRELAEAIGQNLTKGQRVIAQGNLKQRSFKDREGNDRTSLELDILEIGPLIQRQKPNAQRAGQPAQAAGLPPGAQPVYHVPQGYDPDAPF